MQFSEVIDRRRSIRAFRATAIEEQKINAILATAKSAPSAGDLHAYRIVVVTDAETKALLAKAALGQQFIAEAPTMLVFFADIRRSKAKYGSRGAELFCLQDATIAAAYAQLAATEEKLGSWWEHSTMHRSASRSARRLTCGPSPSCPLATPPRRLSAPLDVH